MKNYKMIITYDGTRYYGWEHQPTTDMTIQGKLESVLSAMTGTEVEVIGAGRTDAGVHAKGMVANAHMETKMKEDEICDYMNRYLPEDICVQEVRVASDRFHSRYNAQGKTYCYTCYVGDKKPVFNRKYVNIIEGKLDVDAMKRAADILTGEHDFASFCSYDQYGNTIRELYELSITNEKGIIKFILVGNGFRRYMVRHIVGGLIQVGAKRVTKERLQELLDSKGEQKCLFKAKPQGLYLHEVFYDEN